MLKRSLCVVLICAATSLAQEAKPPKVLKLSPALAPVPAMKYRLLPEVRDQTPGNAITGYYRAFSPEWQGYRREPNWSETISQAMEMPLTELRGSETAKKLGWLHTWPMFKEIDRAARRSHCNWDLAERIREDGMMLLLPDVQGMRELGRLLAIRARLEIADGDFAAAARTLQTGYALARHAGEGPTLINGLVGIAITMHMNTQVEAWMQAPGSPNLYWALTDLPVPFIDLRKCFQGERLFIDNLLPGIRECLKDPEHPAFSPGQMRQMIYTFASAIGGNTDAHVFGMALAAPRYTGAKKFLAEQGWTAAQIEAMPALQAVCMQEVYEYDRHYDAMTCAVHLPYREGRPVIAKAEAKLGQPAQNLTSAMPMLARMLAPTTIRMIASRTRLDRQIAALRTIEAIRMYAATHDGKLPATLEAITAAPIPRDPVTEKPFDYTVMGDTATLSGSVPPGEKQSFAVYFELTIRK